MRWERALGVIRHCPLQRRAFEHAEALLIRFSSRTNCLIVVFAQASGSITAYVHFGSALRHHLRPRTQPMSWASVCAGTPTCFGLALDQRVHPFKSNDEPSNSFGPSGPEIRRLQ